jgi:hypothetical protein
MSGLQQTYNITPPDSNRADFHRTDFEKLIHEKGRNVIVEKAIQCPCKGKETNQQSNCKNCGGCGWLFINPKQTRLVLQGMNITPDYKAWSEEIKGDLKVSASDTEELTFMDRITVVDSIAYFNEVLFFKTKGSGSSAVTFAFTTYNIKSVKYIGYFRGTDQTLQMLSYGTDFLFERNIIKIINPAIVPVQSQISVTVRYTHAPQYHMIDMKRESMESFELLGSEKLIHLPVSGTARRAHYILTANNLAGDRLLDNSYSIPCSDSTANYCSTQIVTVPVVTDGTLVVSFINQTEVDINHKKNRYVDATVYESVTGNLDKIMTPNVGCVVERVDINNVKVTFPQPTSGTIVIQ